MKRLLLPLLLVVLAAVAGAQEVAPKVELVLNTKVLKPGALAKGSVFVTFAPGLHGYQNPPSKDYMIPVTLESATKGIKIKAAYPTGIPMPVPGETDQAKVYEGQIEIPFEFTLPKKPGKLKLELKLGYQQCDASACFAPGAVTVTKEIVVKKK